MRPRINIKASSPYLPLFQRGGTRYKLVLGGRGSAKSFTVATALIDRTYDDDGTILFTRYTLVNAEVSILPEFVDKIERLGLQGDFTKSGNDLVNIRTGGRILFRGIKTSSGINTAALKSIPKLKMWVNDESEELVDESIFDTIDLSIRYNDAPAEVWLVANPPDIDHFLYRRFFKQRGIEDVWNGTKDDVTYIWTTYLTNPHLPDEYVALAERSKAVDMAYYEHVWLGHFATHKEGLIYKGWQEVTDAMWPTHLPCWYGVDWGFACIKEGTLIATDRGGIPIEQIEAGDLVLTTDGYHKVLKRQDCGERDIITQEIKTGDGVRRLSATTEHLININGKWKKYGELRETDALCTLSRTTESSIGDTRLGSIRTTTTQSGKRTEGQSRKPYTAKSMRTTSGQSPQGTPSTTKTSTRSIMAWITCNLSRLLNICKSTATLSSTTQNTKEARRQRKQSPSAGLVSCETFKPSRESANNAGRSSTRQTYTSDSARRNATTSGNILRRIASSLRGARCAAKSSCITSTSNNGVAVQNVRIASQSINALRVVECRKAHAYDLQVEGKNEYFANGILVHNCDPAAVVRVTYDPDTHTVWVKELLYETGMLTADIARVVRTDIANRRRTHKVGERQLEWHRGILSCEGQDIPLTNFDNELAARGFVGWQIDDIREWVGGIERLDGEIYCDPARPEQIREMKINHGLWAMAAINADKVGRIEYLKYFDVRFIGSNIDKEIRNYRWQTSKTDKTKYINKPQDGNDHLADSISYAVCTHLRRLGIANKLGEQ